MCGHPGRDFVNQSDLILHWRDRRGGIPSCAWSVNKASETRWSSTGVKDTFRRGAFSVQSVGNSAAGSQPSLNKKDARRWEVLCVQGCGWGFSNKSVFTEHPVANLGKASRVQRALADLCKRAGRHKVAPSGRSRARTGGVGQTLVLSQPSSHTVRVICAWGSLELRPGNSFRAGTHPCLSLLAGLGASGQ